MLNTISGLLGGGAPIVGDYESIATTIVGSGGSSSVTFNLSGVSGYKHLQLRAMARSTGAFWFQTQINGDTSTGYASHAVYGVGSGTPSAFGTGTGVANYGYTALIEGDGQTALIMDLLDYANTTTNKTVRTLWGNDRNGAGAVGLNSFFRPSQTGAITSLAINGTFLQYSHFALYGIKG